jgi:hypothetical protein
MTNDPIYPEHYKAGRKYEPIDVIEDWGLNYRLGNALKYISRNGRKDGENPIEGLKKAIYYLEREIKYLEQYKLDRPVDYKEIKEWDNWCFTPVSDFIGQAEWDSVCDI